MSNPDFSGSYPPDPAEPGRWDGSRDRQRGEGYGDSRRARGTRDAGDRSYRRERDYEWDRGAGADPGYARADNANPPADNGRRHGGRPAHQDPADQGRADQGRADQGRADQG
ncbi:MAG: hypothetical protein ACR2MP_10105, partial [Streptosporangiaceae bacterium]